MTAIQASAAKSVAPAKAPEANQAKTIKTQSATEQSAPVIADAQNQVQVTPVKVEAPATNK
jgi:hypothetical protein